MHPFADISISQTGLSDGSKYRIEMLRQVQDIDLKLLRVFRAIARNGGFAAAQTELNLSLPTISLQMKQLEERLGLRLCERGHGGFRLTPHGEAVLKASHRLFSAIDEFRNELADMSNAPLGEVSLGMLDHLTANPLCRVHDALARMHERYTGVEPIFFVGPPDELEGQVIGGTLDMAVGLFQPRNATLSHLVLFEEEHTLYGAAQHPLIADGLPTLDRIGSSDYISWGNLEQLVAHRTPIKFKLRAGTPFMDGVVTLILSGRFIGYLPTYFAQRWVVTGQIAAILPEQLTRRAQVALITRRETTLTRGAAALYREIAHAHQALDDLSKAQTEL